MNPTPLDRSSPLPLWAQLEADLRRRLDAGDFDAGFPTDQTLTEDYAVSRHTVREAIRHLNRTGLLKRERGRGTVVNRTEFEQSLGALYSLFESVESSGVEQTSRVLGLEIVTDPAVAARLDVDEDTELMMLERLRLAGGAPLAVDRAWLPLAITRPLLDVDWTRTALYAELAKAGSPVPDQGWERLTPIVPTLSDRKKLGLRGGAAAFFLERLGCRGETPLEWRTTVVRGDRYSFLARWSLGSTGGLEMTLSE